MELKLIPGIILFVLGAIGFIAFDSQDAKATQAVVFMVGGFIIVFS